MKKKNQQSLRVALGMAKEGADGDAYTRAPAETVTPAALPNAAASPKSPKRFGVYVPHAAVMKALIDLQHAETTEARRPKLNDYFLEGLDAVFAKRDLPSIAQLIEQAEKRKA